MLGDAGSCCQYTVLTTHTRSTNGVDIRPRTRVIGWTLRRVIINLTVISQRVSACIGGAIRFSGQIGTSLCLASRLRPALEDWAEYNYVLRQTFSISLAFYVDRSVRSVPETFRSVGSQFGDFSTKKVLAHEV